MPRVVLVVAMAALALLALVRAEVCEEEWDDDLAAEERNANDSVWPEPDRIDMNVVRHSALLSSEGCWTNPLHVRKACGRLVFGHDWP